MRLFLLALLAHALPLPSSQLPTPSHSLEFGDRLKPIQRHAQADSDAAETTLSLHTDGDGVGEKALPLHSHHVNDFSQKEEDAPVLERKATPRQGHSAPRSSFTCDGREAGFHADTHTSCKVFHRCGEVENKGVRIESFICLNGTTFNEQSLSCESKEHVLCNTPSNSSNSSQALKMRVRDGKYIQLFATVGVGEKSTPQPPMPTDDFQPVPSQFESPLKLIQPTQPPSAHQQLTNDLDLQDPSDLNDLNDPSDLNDPNGSTDSNDPCDLDGSSELSDLCEPSDPNDLTALPSSHSVHLPPQKDENKDDESSEDDVAFFFTPQQLKNIRSSPGFGERVNESFQSPQTTKLQTTKPQTTKLQTTKPQTTKLQTTKPQTIKLQITKSQTTNPEAFKLQTTKPQPTKQEAFKPQTTKPQPKQRPYPYIPKSTKRHPLKTDEPNVETLTTKTPTSTPYSSHSPKSDGPVTRRFLFYHPAHAQPQQSTQLFAEERHEAKERPPHAKKDLVKHVDVKMKGFQAPLSNVDEEAEQKSKPDKPNKTHKPLKPLIRSSVRRFRRLKYKKPYEGSINAVDEGSEASGEEKQSEVFTKTSSEEDASSPFVSPQSLHYEQPLSMHTAEEAPTFATAHPQPAPPPPHPLQSLPPFSQQFPPTHTLFPFANTHPQLYFPHLPTHHLLHSAPQHTQTTPLPPHLNHYHQQPPQWLTYHHVHPQPLPYHPLPTHEDAFGGGEANHLTDAYAQSHLHRDTAHSSEHHSLPHLMRLLESGSLLAL